MKFITVEFYKALLMKTCIQLSTYFNVLGACQRTVNVLSTYVQHIVNVLSRYFNVLGACQRTVKSWHILVDADRS